MATHVGPKPPKNPQPGDDWYQPLSKAEYRHIITCGECRMQLASRPGWTLDHIDDGSHIARPEVEPDPIF